MSCLQCGYRDCMSTTFMVPRLVFEQAGGKENLILALRETVHGWNAMQLCPVSFSGLKVTLKWNDAIFLNSKYCSCSHICPLSHHTNITDYDLSLVSRYWFRIFVKYYHSMTSPMRLLLTTKYSAYFIENTRIYILYATILLI